MVTQCAGRIPNHVVDINANKVLPVNAESALHHFDRESHLLTQYAGSITHKVNNSNARSIFIKLKVQNSKLKLILIFFP